MEEEKLQLVLPTKADRTPIDVQIDHDIGGSQALLTLHAEQSPASRPAQLPLPCLSANMCAFRSTESFAARPTRRDAIYLDCSLSGAKPQPDGSGASRPTTLSRKGWDAENWTSYVEYETHCTRLLLGCINTDFRNQLVVAVCFNYDIA